MDALAQKLDQGLARGAELASQGFQWLREHGDTLLAVLKPLAGAIDVYKRQGEQRRLVGPYQLDQGPGSGVQELEGRLLQGHGAGLHAHRQPQQ